ncbi:Uncharacterised protein [Streptococcus pneumoniae]|nr:Uncharacterised protein [Streptococcus pneumoniae]
MIRRAGGVVEVRLDLLGLVHGLLQTVVQAEHLLAAVVLDHPVQCGLHGGHAGVAVLVDAVAEAHDLLLLGQGVLHPCLRSGGGVLTGLLLPDADLVEGVHHGLVGAAVQRALERADRTGHGRVQVGERRGDHARGEGRGVERVLGVQHHRDAERVHDLRGGLLAERHPQEVLRVVQVLTRLHHLLAAATALVVGDDGWERREQRLGLLQLGLGGGVLRLRVVRAEHGHGGAADVHGVAVGGQQVDGLLHLRVEGTVGALEALERGQLLVRGQLTRPEQQRDGLERQLRGQVLHGIAAIQQGVRLRVDLGDRRGVHDDAGQALLDLGLGHGVPPRGVGPARARAGPVTGQRSAWLAPMSSVGTSKLKMPVSKAL